MSNLSDFGGCRDAPWSVRGIDWFSVVCADAPRSVPTMGRWFSAGGRNPSRRRGGAKVARGRTVFLYSLAYSGEVCNFASPSRPHGGRENTPHRQFGLPHSLKVEGRLFSLYQTKIICVPSGRMISAPRSGITGAWPYNRSIHDGLFFTHERAPAHIPSPGYRQGRACSPAPSGKTNKLLP